jgi:hypothetical protein
MTGENGGGCAGADRDPPLPVRNDSVVESPWVPHRANPAFTQRSPQGECGIPRLARPAGYSALWQTASTLLPSGSITNAP